MSTKDQRDAREDFRQDGRPLLYVPPPRPVDAVAGEPPASSSGPIQTYGLVESAQGRISSARTGSPEGLSEVSKMITLPAIDFPTPPVAGGTVYIGPGGQRTFPVPGADGVTALRVTAPYDTIADGVDEILYIILATGDGPPRPTS